MTQKTDGLVALISPPNDPHFVIRYDHRDTGRSTSFTKSPDDDSPVYTLNDMVNDAVGLIEHLNLEEFHLWLLGEAFSVPEDLNDDEAWIESYMSLDLALAVRPPTEAEKAESRRESEVTYRRERDSGTMWTKHNHSDASGPRWPRESLKEIRCPTVVIHAAKDQIFPMRPAEALRDDVEGATLVVLEDCGHELPHRVRHQVADTILANVKKGGARAVKGER
ncbi:hypothetical protein EKO27_g3413 [Xylaria grammica]|uniref:Uncharacterized protein n=1 Tax=Xylaria grammica TaxID=363999 RepID=A0A439DBC1_9PEZI|nr:hypothetical protein EKO27_g3413 [Xylaria grammica]